MVALEMVFSYTNIRTWTFYLIQRVKILSYIVKYVINLRILRRVYPELSRRPYNHADLYKIQIQSKGTEADIRSKWPQPRNARAITRRQRTDFPLEPVKDCSFTIFWTFSLQINERLYFHCLSYHIRGNSGL